MASPSPRPFQLVTPAPDIVVIGGGIVGLWSTWVAARKGMLVQLIDEATLGSRASGGILGALMPHQPNSWSPKKQFQLDGLISLPHWVSAIENATGKQCGYDRVGRIMPINHQEKRRQSQIWVDGAKMNWPDALTWRVTDDHPAPDWATNTASHGWNADTLSARINPRALVDALVKWVREQPNVAVCENMRMDAETLKKLVVPKIVSAGVGSFSLVNKDEPRRAGKPVKGQGATLRPIHPINSNAPIIYDQGTYVIAHADGTIAVGSTSENEFAEAQTTDQQLDEVIASATAMCEALEGAQVIERWADTRPKAGKPDPLLGHLTDHKDTIIATGGFKITFAIAHLMAEIAVDLASGTEREIPDAFRPALRLK
ncbi:MAG: FAD-binding oxidoreductase [Pseudomonadota bacterium]